jgi:integrase
MEMPADVEDLLRARQTDQKREQLKAGRKWAGNAQDLVFTTRHGTPIPHNNVGGSWRVAVGRVDGLPYMKPHGSRHYAASYQFDAGASVAEVGALLGQDDRTVTRTYIHLTHRSRSAAADRANALPRRPRKAINQ